MPRDNQDKKFVIEFFRRKRIEAREIPQSSNSATPDFGLYISNDLFAYCELKSIIHCEWVSSNLPIGQARQVYIQGNAPVNDIKKDINKAYKQLRSINPDHKVPNIVIIINHNPLRNVGDLWDVIGTSWNVPLYRNKLLRKADLEVADCIIFVQFQAKKDEKWPKEALSRKSFPTKAYYFLSAESHLQNHIKERISSKCWEVLTNTA